MLKIYIAALYGVIFIVPGGGLRTKNAAQNLPHKIWNRLIRFNHKYNKQRIK